MTNQKAPRVWTILAWIFLVLTFVCEGYRFMHKTGNPAWLDLVTHVLLFFGFFAIMFTASPKARLLWMLALMCYAFVIIIDVMQLLGH